MKCKDKPCDFSECDLLALSTVITRKIAEVVTDADTLSLVADFVASVGDSLTLIAGQRERCKTKP